ncbi:MAG: DUF3794 domain-containing protein [Clostridia bacterium]|nr:DUF3794 domain-containing protein [Clostridia bacterium]
MEINTDRFNSDKLQILTTKEKLRLTVPLDNVKQSILCANASASVNSCRILACDVRAEGEVRVSVIVEGEEFDTLHIEQDFSSTISLERDATVHAFARVTSCRVKRQGSSAVVDVELSVKFICITDISCDVITSATGIETVKRNLESDVLVGIFTQDVQVNEDIELNVRMPQIKQCLLVSPSAVVDKVMLTDDSVMLSGDVILSVLYSCGDEYEPITQVADRLPFSAVIPAQGVDPSDTAIITIQVRDGGVMPKENQQGESRVLACDLSITCTACITRKNTIEAVTNAYSITNMLECTQEQMNLSSLSECKKQQSVRVTLEKPEEMPPIARVCGVNAFTDITKVHPYNGGVSVKCRSCFHVVYIVSGSGEMAGFDAVEEYEINIDCPCSTDSSVEVMLENELLQAALISGSKCEIRMVFGAELYISDPSSANVIKSIEQGQEREPMRGIFLYITQPGDDLFTVGKQLGVSIEDILALNPELDREKLKQGSRITVMR